MTEIWWKPVPELRRRAAESSAPHSNNTVKNIFKICYHNIFSFVKSTL